MEQARERRECGEKVVGEEGGLIVGVVGDRQQIRISVRRRILFEVGERDSTISTVLRALCLYKRKRRMIWRMLEIQRSNTSQLSQQSIVVGGSSLVYLTSSRLATVQNIVNKARARREKSRKVVFLS